MDQNDDIMDFYQDMNAPAYDYYDPKTDRRWSALRFAKSLSKDASIDDIISVAKKIEEYINS